MNARSPELERLISRFLDDEATPAERRDLQQRRRADADVEQAVQDALLLDQATRRVLRQAFGRPVEVTPSVRPAVRWRLVPILAMAAAAGLTLAVWLRPTAPPVAGPGDVQQAGHLGSSWFGPPAAGAPAEFLPQVPSAFERPQVRFRNTDRHWIIVPGRNPGEFMLIEMDRIRTHAVVVQSDF